MSVRKPHTSEIRAAHPYLKKKLSAPQTNINFQRKNYTNWPTFGPNFDLELPDIIFFFKIFLNFSHFFSIFIKFSKLTYSYTIFCIEEGVIGLSGGWFCYPCWQDVPVGSLVLSIPPPPPVRKLGLVKGFCCCCCWFFFFFLFFFPH